jgi:TolB protein
MKNKPLLNLAFVLLSLPAPAFAAQTEQPIIVVGAVKAFAPPIPVYTSGFTGEADSVIRFDLLFMGFEQTTQDKARYLIQGKNSPGRVEAVVVDPIAKQTKLAKAFTGAGTRAQVHALADDIAQTLTGKPGIAQTKIAFVGQRDGVGPGEIYVSDYDGFNPQAVTQDGVIVGAPTWAGKSLLYYTSFKTGKPEILSQNLATGVRRAIARFNSLNTGAAVSPDGRHLAMILGKSGSPELYVSDLDGGNLRQLTKGKGVNASPCWSPDNRTICYVSDHRAGFAELYTISINGGAPVRLPTTGVSRPTEPDWSPDGKFIVFTSQSRDFAICLVHMEGPQRGVVMKQFGEKFVTGQDPVWAPNSRAVIFTRNVNHRYVLSLLDVPTGQVKDINRISGSASQPSWAR